MHTAFLVPREALDGRTFSAILVECEQIRGQNCIFKLLNPVFFLGSLWAKLWRTPDITVSLDISAAAALPLTRMSRITVAAADATEDTLKTTRGLAGRPRPRPTMVVEVAALWTMGSSTSTSVAVSPSSSISANTAAAASAAPRVAASDAADDDVEDD